MHERGQTWIIMGMAKASFFLSACARFPAIHRPVPFPCGLSPVLIWFPSHMKKYWNADHQSTE